MSEFDKSPANEMPALGPPHAGQLHVPQFGILHLMLWTTVTAILLGLEMVLRGNSFDQPTTGYAWLSRIPLILSVIMSASALVGAGVLVRHRFYTILYRLQPGHWLVLIVSLDVVLRLTARLLYRFYHLDGFHQASVATTQGVSAMTSTLIAAAYVLSFVKLCDAKRWKILIGAKAVGAAMTAAITWVLFVAIVSAPWPYALAPPLSWLIAGPTVWFVVVFVLLLVAAATDLRRHIARDWLHWLGVSVVVIANVLTFANFLRLLLPGRLLGV